MNIAGATHCDVHNFGTRVKGMPRLSRNDKSLVWRPAIILIVLMALTQLSASDVMQRIA